MTREEYMMNALLQFEEYGGWRMGQTHWNVLVEFRPELAERLHGTELDPFYSDNVIPQYLRFIFENWD
jgi:hypothetical protein